jgi:hypothetical protein
MVNVRIMEEKIWNTYVLPSITLGNNLKFFEREYRRFLEYF